MIPLNCSESEARSGAINIIEPAVNIPKKPLFAKWPRLACDVVPQRTYEQGQWYYLVFKPTDKGYDLEYNALDYIRKFISKQNKVNCYVITRERISAKVHWNVLINCEKDLTMYADHPTQRFYIHVDYLAGLGDRTRVYNYITKEYYVNHIEWNRYYDYDYKL